MDYYKSRFKSSIRIDPKQKEWMRKHKVCRTMAGFLDIVINKYKKQYERQLKKQQMSDLQTADTQKESLGVRTLRDENDSEGLQPVADRSSI